MLFFILVGLWSLRGGVFLFGLHTICFFFVFFSKGIVTSEIKQPNKPILITTFALLSVQVV